MRSSTFLAATMQLVDAHGADAVLAALQQAVEFPTRPLSAHKINTSEEAGC